MPSRYSTPVPSDTSHTDLQAQVAFLNSVHDKARQMVQHVDAQTNVLIAFSSAIFVYSISQVREREFEISYLVLALFSGASTLVSLFAIHPPRFLRKRGQHESVMYNHMIAKLASADMYAAELARTLASRDAMIAEYAKEIYNLCKLYYRPKRELFKLARHVLLMGMGAAFFTFLIELAIISF